eukprot:TRINITY_DN526_c0_g1_i1.p1 TRINITY_DN526_c0_g1~~TRINITY_DN526_c0_g1_i1.p1  ORF type:complete len:250 (-),score=93.25 TRINITY_DN526_c0_g1_i1:80-802(-)
MSNTLEGEQPKLDLDLKKKKIKKKKTGVKKTKKPITKETESTEIVEKKEPVNKIEELLPELDLSGKKKGSPKETPVEENWNDNERDYDYFELLNRIQGLLQESGSSSGQAAKMKLPPPVLVRDGTTKTVWSNFPVICSKMNRPIEHFQNYALVELNTTGSLDVNSALTIKGRFQPKQAETVIKHYISEFVKCNTCQSVDTVLKKENRMHFLYCNSCLSRRTVQTIKAGYVHTIKRSKIKV